MTIMPLFNDVLQEFLHPVSQESLLLAFQILIVSTTCCLQFVKDHLFCYLKKNFLQSLILGFVSEFTVYFETVQNFLQIEPLVRIQMHSKGYLYYMYLYKQIFCFLFFKVFSILFSGQYLRVKCSFQALSCYGSRHIVDDQCQ